MKANLFIHNKEMEIRLANGEQFTAEKGESKEDLILRVSDHLDLLDGSTLEDPKEIDIKKIKSISSDQMIKRLKNLRTSVETQMYIDVLEARGVEIPVEEIETKSEEVKPKKEKKLKKKN